MFLLKVDLAHVLTSNCLFFIVPVIYTAWLVIYRLYLSPIAHIPGPKLAALTQWYEAYYNIYLDGQFTFHIAALHEKYGILPSSQMGFSSSNRGLALQVQFYVSTLGKFTSAIPSSLRPSIHRNLSPKSCGIAHGTCHRNLVFPL